MEKYPRLGTALLGLTFGLVFGGGFGLILWEGWQVAVALIAGITALSISMLQGATSEPEAESAQRLRLALPWEKSPLEWAQIGLLVLVLLLENQTLATVAFAASLVVTGLLLWTGFKKR